MATRNQIDAVIATHRSQIESAQENYKLLNNKYRQYKRGDFNDSIEVHEYVRPNRDVGYIVYVYADEGQDVYVKTFHIGTEPLNITQNTWIKKVDSII